VGTKEGVTSFGPERSSAAGAPFVGRDLKVLGQAGGLPRDLWGPGPLVIFFSPSSVPIRPKLPVLPVLLAQGPQAPSVSSAGTTGTSSCWTDGKRRVFPAGSRGPRGSGHRSCSLATP
jgi:hypothetical protein